MSNPTDIIAFAEKCKAGHTVLLRQVELATALLIAVDSLEHLTKAMSASDAKEAQEALSRICSIKVQ